MEMFNFYIDTPKKDSRFVAFFDDGSGADLFCRRKNGDFFNAEGHFLDLDWFLDAGYLTFMYLPNDFKFFFEGSKASQSTLRPIKQ